MSEFHESRSDDIDSLVNTLEQFGIRVENELLTHCNSAYETGRDWVLQRFNHGERPRLCINANPDVLHAFVSRTADEKGELAIFMPSYYFRALIGCNKMAVCEKQLSKKNGETIRCIYTVGQIFEECGIEETAHWLAAKGTAGLTPIDETLQLPLPRNNIEEYLAQPHELEALRLYHEYFLAKYHVSPVQGLVDMVEDYLSNRNA